jgi:uncharacterized protein (DUF433 family)
MLTNRKSSMRNVGSSHRDHCHTQAIRGWDRQFMVRQVLERSTFFSSEVKFKDVLKRALQECPSISLDHRRMQGRPCIAGTRIPVHLVLWAVEQHGSIDGALKSYPDLNVQQVKDALYFAETVLGSSSVITQTAPIA